MQAPDEAWCKQKSAIVMNGGITKIRCDGIPAVLRVNALEVLRHLIKSFVPPEPVPTVWSAAHGIFQPVFVIVKISQGSGLRADVPSAERVVFVTADVQTLVGLNGDFDAAYRFAEIAGAVMNGAIVGGSHGSYSVAVKARRKISDSCSPLLLPPAKLCVRCKFGVMKNILLQDQQTLAYAINLSRE